MNLGFLFVTLSWQVAGLWLNNPLQQDISPSIVKIGEKPTTNNTKAISKIRTELSSVSNMINALVTSKKPIVFNKQLPLKNEESTSMTKKSIITKTNLTNKIEGNNTPIIFKDKPVKEDINSIKKEISTVSNLISTMLASRKSNVNESAAHKIFKKLNNEEFNVATGMIGNSSILATKKPVVKGPSLVAEKSTFVIRNAKIDELKSVNSELSIIAKEINILSNLTRDEIHAITALQDKNPSNQNKIDSMPMFSDSPSSSTKKKFASDNPFHKKHEQIEHTKQTIITKEIDALSNITRDEISAITRLSNKKSPTEITISDPSELSSNQPNFPRNESPIENSLRKMYAQNENTQHIYRGEHHKTLPKPTQVNNLISSEHQFETPDIDAKIPLDPSRILFDDDQSENQSENQFDNPFDDEISQHQYSDQISEHHHNRPFNGHIKHNQYNDGEINQRQYYDQINRDHYIEPFNRHIKQDQYDDASNDHLEQDPYNEQNDEYQLGDQSYEDTDDYTDDQILIQKRTKDINISHNEK